MLENSPLHIKNFDKFVEVREQVIKNDRNHGKNQYINDLTDEIKNNIKELHLKGWSYAKIAEKLETSRSAISGILYRDRVNKRKYKGDYV